MAGILSDLGGGLQNFFGGFGGGGGNMPGVTDDERKYLQQQGMQNFGRMLMVLGMPMTAQQRAQAMAQFAGNMPDPTSQLAKMQEMKVRQMQLQQMQADADWAKQNGFSTTGTQPITTPDPSAGIQTTPPAPQNAPLTPQQQAITSPSTVPQPNIPGITAEDMDLINRTVPPSQRKEALKDLALKRMQETREQVVPLNDEERAYYRIPEGQPAFKKIKTYASGRSEIVDVNAPNIQRPENKIESQVAEVFGGQLKDQIAGARSSANTLKTNNQMLGLLDEGIFTGALASEQLKGAKYVTALSDITGIPAEQLEKKVANTEAYLAEVKNKVIELARQLGNNPSNSDREFALQVAGGQIELNETSMRRILAQSSKLERERLGSYNQMVKGIQDSPLPDSMKKLISPIIKPIDVPEYTPPAPVPIQPQQTQPQKRIRIDLDGNVIQ